MEKISAARYGFVFSGAVTAASLGYTVYGALTVTDVVQAFKYAREAPVIIYWHYKALHVDVGPWRYYLDVDYDRVIRLTKMGFNSNINF